MKLGCTSALGLDTAHVVPIAPTVVFEPEHPTSVVAVASIVNPSPSPQPQRLPIDTDSISLPPIRAEHPQNRVEKVSRSQETSENAHTCAQTRPLGPLEGEVPVPKYPTPL
jgi:hypothetical protein